MISQKAHGVANPKKGQNGSSTKVVEGFIGFLKLGRRLVVQLPLHSLDALYDLFRYLRYSNSLLRSTHDRQKLESLLFFYNHKIEKSLALPEVKPLFGLGYIETLLDLIDQWGDLTGDFTGVVFRSTYGALVCYREQVGISLSQERPDLVRRIDKLLTNHKEGDGTSHLGGTMTITREEQQPAFPMTAFDHLIHQRHSVRNFTRQPIPDSSIYQAVRLAQQSPSVCNRQCWRAHVFSSAQDKAKVLRHQNGNTGFGHLADRVLLITADLRPFISSGERNQAYTDAGMFAMTLLYALQAQGIASCCLNLDNSLFEDLSLRRACKIPETEIPIMMIAIGYPPESLQVAAAVRVPTENILSFRNLDADSRG